MDPETTTDASQADAPVTLPVLLEALKQERESNRAEFKAELDTLRQPDRSNVPDLAGDRDGMVDETSEQRKHQSMISRNQPTDGLYRSLYRSAPDLVEYRSDAQDHWSQRWLVGLALNNEVMLYEARDKLEEINARAISLEGVLDVSDPTAILDGTAGHLLPQNLNAVVQIARDAVASLPQLLLSLELTSGTTRVPTSGAATAAMVLEAGTPGDGEPPFLSDMLTPKKAVVFMSASKELLADSAFNVMQIYSQRAGTALGALEDVQIATSNGTAPNISEALAGGDVAEASSTVLIYEDLVTLFFALAQIYRGGATWTANAVTLTLMSQLMDGNDHPILSFPGVVAPVGSGPGGGAQAGQVGTIFGRPVVEAPFADGTLIFGNLGMGYGFARRSGIEATASTHAQFKQGIVEFLFEERFDGRIIDDVAIKQMTGLATVA